LSAQIIIISATLFYDKKNKLIMAIYKIYYIVYIKNIGINVPYNCNFTHGSKQTNLLDVLTATSSVSIELI
jgi:hypothetical protein